MAMPSRDVWDVIEAEGVTHLHHANSVLTSCNFLRNKALLSRGAVEEMELHQTAQYTDDTDKRYRIWDDVFTDGVDIHHRASRVNKYGPVLFVLSLEKIRAVRTGRVSVTKLNPTKWAGTRPVDRWFQSKRDLQDNYGYGTFDHMVVFRRCNGVLPIADCLEKIVLDEPNKRVEGFDLASTAYGALTLAMSDSGMQVPIEIRNCEPGCTCRAHYRARHNLSRTIEMFYPHG
jgi:hypothetical protein